MMYQTFFLENNMMTRMSKKVMLKISLSVLQYRDKLSVLFLLLAPKRKRWFLSLLSSSVISRTAFLPPERSSRNTGIATPDKWQTKWWEEEDEEKGMKGRSFYQRGTQLQTFMMKAQQKEALGKSVLNRFIPQLLCAFTEATFTN